MMRKEGKFFLLYCQNFDDREDILALYDTLNFNGALLVLKPWKLEASFRSLNFSETTMWIKVEGLPVVLSSMQFATRLLEKVGKVMLFDDQSSLQGQRDSKIKF